MDRKIIFGGAGLLALVILSAALAHSRASSASASETSSFLPEIDRAGSNTGLYAVKPDVAAASDATDVFISAAKAKLAPTLVDGKWINSEPLTLEKLHGRVVLVEFWTFGCFNCINTLPTMKSLDAKYRDKGLTIVGIETPELDFEKSFDGLQKAVKQRGIEYPVLTDYNSANWNSFDVEAWPTIFILDKDGRIRYEHVGEGEYKTEEKVISALLAEGK